MRVDVQPLLCQKAQERTGTRLARGLRTALTKSEEPQSFAGAAKFCATRAAVDVQPLFCQRATGAHRNEVCASGAEALTKSEKPQSFARAAKFCATRARVDVQPLFCQRAQERTGTRLARAELKSSLQKAKSRRASQEQRSSALQRRR